MNNSTTADGLDFDALQRMADTFRIAKSHTITCGAKAFHALVLKALELAHGSAYPGLLSPTLYYDDEGHAKVMILHGNTYIRVDWLGPLEIKEVVLPLTLPPTLHLTPRIGGPKLDVETTATRSPAHYRGVYEPGHNR